MHPQIDIRGGGSIAAVTEIDGFPAFAPELAHGHDGFADAAHDMLDDLEDSHFWFRCRRDLILDLLARHGSDARDFAEIGCGNGSVLAAVADEHPDWQVYGIEASVAGLRHARRRVPRARLIQADATRLPFESQFDAVGIFDVLEHIDDDRAVLRGIRRSLRPHGRLLITVPQHPSLWSWTDDHACHRRRYTRRELLDKLSAAGFRPRRCTSYLNWLLPVVMLSRLGRSPQQLQLQAPPAFVDRIFSLATRAELALTSRGWDHRWGGSLVVVAERSD
jgi:SAM-dependent methyltransferase